MKSDSNVHENTIKIRNILKDSTFDKNDIHNNHDNDIYNNHDNDILIINIDINIIIDISSMSKNIQVSI
jgi:hypothetical protein